MSGEEPIFGELARALPRVSPPAELYAQIERTLGLPTPPQESAHRSRRFTRARLGLVGLAAAAAGAAAAITLAVTQSHGLGAAAARATLAGPRQAGSLSGQAWLYRPDQAGGELRLELDGVPSPPSGEHYEVWVLPVGSQVMTAVGSFTPASGQVGLLLPLPAPARYSAVEISIQADNGPACRAPTTLASGGFNAAG